MILIAVAAVGFALIAQRASHRLAMVFFVAMTMLMILHAMLLRLFLDSRD